MARDDGGGGGGSSPAGSAGSLPLLGRRSPGCQGLAEKLRRAREDNRRLAGALDAILADHTHPTTDLASLLASVVSTATTPTGPTNAAAAAAGSSREPTAEPRPKVRMVCVRADPSDSDINLAVKDGYQWRKYGQKVIRDNPYPIAYFRCAYAPSCPVKKKVQRTAEDSSVLMAKYEGEHNHAQPSTQSELAAGTSVPPQLPCSIFINSSGRTITLDLASQVSGAGTPAAAPTPSVEAISRDLVSTPEFLKLLTEEMVNLLKNDAEFVEALTSAVAVTVVERFQAGHFGAHL